MQQAFKYKDSYGNGIAVLLVLVSVVVDMIAIRCGLAIIAATLLLWPFFHRKFGMTPAITLVLVSVLGALIGGAWWLFDSRHAHSEENVSNVSVFFDCYMGSAPTRIPATGLAVTYILQNRSMAVLTAPGEPNSERNPQSMPDQYKFGYNCKISFYTEKPIFNIHTTYTLRLVKAVILDNGGAKGGDPAGDVTFDVSIPQIDPATDRSYSFFVVSLDESVFANIHYPTSLTYETTDGTKLSAKLVKSNPPIFGIRPPTPPKHSH